MVAMDISTMNKRRQHELAQFLRKARARAKPELTGIQTGIRRRTTGLRREEVASLAGVSTIWYTWLEQGRDVQPSERLLDALAIALQMTPSEREYLHRLGRIIRSRSAERTGVFPELWHLLAQLPVPGFLADHRWQMLGHNVAADVLLPNEASELEQQNIMRLIFLSPAIRGLVVEWRDLARAAVSMFHISYARNIDDGELSALVEELRSESAVFADLWDEQVIEASPKCVKSIRHWDIGMIRYEFVVLRTAENREVNLFALLPADADSAGSWERLRSGLTSHGRSVPKQVVCEI